jgi:hypothetical protein
MTSNENNNSIPRYAGWLRLLIPLFSSDVVEIITSIWRLGRSILRAQAHEGMYEVLEHDLILELTDIKGETAVIRRRQKVKFLQDNILAYQDQAWGDGNIFADYKCSPGVPVDRYREGYLYRVLISLRGTRQRGDIEEFHIERTAKDGFTEDVETLEVGIFQKTHVLSLSLIFPASRLPRSVKLIERNTTKTIVLEAEHMKQLPDGRLQVSWSTKKPRLFEAYILRWEW